MEESHSGQVTPVATGSNIPRNTSLPCIFLCESEWEENKDRTTRENDCLGIMAHEGTSQCC
jgi:hypothetical protein